MGRVTQARAALARARATLEEGGRALGYRSRYLELFTKPYVDQLATELDLRGSNPESAEASLRKVADELSSNPRFDAWGEGLFRLDRIAAMARASGTDEARARHRVQHEEDRPRLLSGYRHVAASGVCVSRKILIVRYL